MFKDGSYTISKNSPISGTLTWVIKAEDIVEMHGDIEKHTTRISDGTRGKIYTFSKSKGLRGLKETDNIHRIMINILFLYGNEMK